MSGKNFFLDILSNINFFKKKKVFSQAYHVCHDGREGHQGASFLCTNGTIFNQKEFACDWWYNVNCQEAPHFYRFVQYKLSIKKKNENLFFYHGIIYLYHYIFLNYSLNLDPTKNPYVPKVKPEEALPHHHLIYKKR